MSNVQLYTQVASEVSPSLRTIVPEPASTHAADLEDAFADEALLEVPSAKSPGHSSAAMPMLEHSLRVTGGRPARFAGRHIAMATGWNNSVARWYEINLYETQVGDIVCDVRLFTKSADSHDLYRVARHGDWQSAAAWLERYNPGHDLVCHVAVDDEALSAAEVSLHGIAIRQQILELQTQYKTLVGNLLYQLKIAPSD